MERQDQMNLRLRFTLRSSLKTLIFLASLCIIAPVKSADFYVATTGDDAATGTLEKPFATIQRAQTAVAPGDTVFIRGGVYQMNESQIAARRRMFAYVTHLSKSGAPGKPITYRAYENEKPVFDYSLVKPAGMRVDAFYVSGSWLHIIGLEVVGVQVTIKRHTQSICFASNGSHNIFERLLMHDGQAIGIYHVDGSDNLFLNCDAWNNWDTTSEDGRGGNVDGFGCHPSAGSTGNVFRGCRAWFNSDDGYDCISAHEAVTFENCWAFYNGLSPKFERTGDGNGFKAGGYAALSADMLPRTIPRHVVRYCLAVGNKASGFYANHHPGGGDWFHNTAYRNGTNFNFLCRLADNRTDVDGFGHVIKNNLSFNSRGNVSRLDLAKCELADNAFPPSVTLTEKDFASLDESEPFQPRQANGDLPAMKFMHPADASKLKGMGAFGR
jgi:hypothetical protein